MRKYEITELGKIILAVLVVIVLLVIPATVLLLKNASAQPSESPSNPPSAASTETPSVSAPSVSIATPSPGQTPDDIPVETPSGSPDVTSAQTPENTSEPTPTQSETPSGQASEPPPVQTPPVSDPNSSSLDGGKLSFIFTPASADGLDRDTDALLDEFLELPDYLPNYKIAVETPKISEADARALMKAVLSALSRRGVKRSQVEHISFPPEAKGGSFEVKMYFVSTKIK